MCARQAERQRGAPPAKRLPGAGIDTDLRAENAPVADRDGLPHADGGRLRVRPRGRRNANASASPSRRRSQARGRPGACPRRSSCRRSATRSRGSTSRQAPRFRRRNRRRRRRRGRASVASPGRGTSRRSALCRSAAATDGPTIVGTVEPGASVASTPAPTHGAGAASARGGRGQNRDRARGEAGCLAAGHQGRVTQVFGIKPLSGGYARSMSRPRRDLAARNFLGGECC